MVTQSKNLKICFLYNEQVKSVNRDHTYFFMQLIEKLKEIHNIELIPESTDAHIGVNYELSVDPGTVIKIHDCELIIEDLDDKCFYILSTHDQLSHCILEQKHNPKLKKVLYSQFIPDEIIHHTGRYYYKYHPWIYFRFSPTDLELYYNKRKNLTEKINKLFFKGATHDRPIINHINPDILPEKNTTQLNTYLEDIIQYKVGLAVGGAANGDLCYRDIEYMQLGIPFIKFEYLTYLNTPLIPNYHYISIPIPEDLPTHNSVKKDRLGLAHHAKLIEEKFNSVINDNNLLETISFNARKYFEKYLAPDKRVEATLKLLNI